MFWKRFWQVWFVIAFCINNYTIFTFNPYNQKTIDFYQNFHVNFLDMPEALIMILGFMGIWAFAWNKKVFTRKFWRIYTPSLIVYNFFYGLTLPLMHPFIVKGELNNLSPSISIFMGVFLAIWSLCNITMYLPLAFYAFKRNNLWNNADIKPYSVWKVIFLYFVIGCLIPTYFIMLRYFTSLNLYEQFDFVFAIPLIAGLYGFAWNKQFFSKLFWQIFVVSLFAWIIGILFVFPHSIVLKTLWPHYTIPVILITIFNSILVLMPLVLYSFKAENIWNPKVLCDEEDKSCNA